MKNWAPNNRRITAACFQCGTRHFVMPGTVIKASSLAVFGASGYLGHYQLLYRYTRATWSHYGYRLASFHRWRVRFIKPYPVSSATDYDYFYSDAFYPPNTPTAVCCEVRSGSRVVFHGSCIEVGNLKMAPALL